MKKKKHKDATTVYNLTSPLPTVARSVSYIEEKKKRRKNTTKTYCCIVVAYNEIKPSLPCYLSFSPTEYSHCPASPHADIAAEYPMMSHRTPRFFMPFSTDRACFHCPPFPHATISEL